ncbi:MAG: DUF2723 domain-containing protein [Planctomycetes bacterium]|nr:DUF2723 domain-containing protein [Planctomycetota bacterium]
MNASHRARLLLLLATAAAFVLHLLVGARTPSEWDVANFLLALDDFDLTQHRPHPPGYPLYVMLGRAAAWWCGDGHRALVVLSALGAALALPATWLLARCWLSPALATWTALAACFAPLTWFYGAVGLASVFELPAVPFVLWLLQRARNGERRPWLLAAVALGIAGGLRPNLVPFLLPAWLLVAWSLPWRARGLGALLLAGTIAAWFVPMVVATDGLTAYRVASGYLDATMQRESLLLGGDLRAVAGHLLRAGSAITLALGPAGVLGLLLLPRLRGPRALPPTALLWAAVLPALAFFVLVLFHKSAYAFVVAVPLLVLAHGALGTLGTTRANLLAAAGLALGTTAWFVLPSERVLLAQADGRLLAHERLPATPRLLRHWLSTTHTALRERDQRVLATDAVIRSARAEQPTLQLVVPGNQPCDARTLLQRWPDLDVWWLPTGAGETPFVARNGVLHPSDAATFARAEAAAASLWLCELDDGTAPPPGRTITAPFVHAVLVPRH